MGPQKVRIPLTPAEYVVTKGRRHRLGAEQGLASDTLLCGLFSADSGTPNCGAHRLAQRVAVKW